MARLIISLIHVYRWAISPFLQPRCRFEPTCSRYAIHALETHGAIHGLWLVIKRLARCHPYEKISKQLGPTFGYDPVPELSNVPANKSTSATNKSTSATNKSTSATNKSTSGKK